jgi:hypothetical protein
VEIFALFHHFPLKEMFSVLLTNVRTLKPPIANPNPFTNAHLATEGGGEKDDEG